jgi:hypothetical protein
MKKSQNNFSLFLFVDKRIWICTNNNGYGSGFGSLRPKNIRIRNTARTPVLRIRIRDWVGYLFDPGIRDGRKSASGSGIRDEQPGSYFLELISHFFAFLGVKILKFCEDPGSGMETVRIRDPGWKKVGSGINIPDPQHCRKHP